MVPSTVGGFLLLQSLKHQVPHNTLDGLHTVRGNGTASTARVIRCQERIYIISHKGLDHGCDEI